MMSLELQGLLPNLTQAPERSWKLLQSRMTIWRLMLKKRLGLSSARTRLEH
jgi:hypothetical protein